VKRPLDLWGSPQGDTHGDCYHTEPHEQDSDGVVEGGAGGGGSHVKVQDAADRKVCDACQPMRMGVRWSLHTEEAPEASHGHEGNGEEGLSDEVSPHLLTNGAHLVADEAHDGGEEGTGGADGQAEGGNQERGTNVAPVGAVRAVDEAAKAMGSQTNGNGVAKGAKVARGVVCAKIQHGPTSIAKFTVRRLERGVHLHVG
jgi:hypothetical protein